METMTLDDWISFRCDSKFDRVNHRPEAERGLGICPKHPGPERWMMMMVCIVFSLGSIIVSTIYTVIVYWMIQVIGHPQHVDRTRQLRVVGSLAASLSEKTSVKLFGSIYPL